VVSAARYLRARALTAAVFEIRPAQPCDADRWIALRAALWPDQDRTALAADVERYFARLRRGPGEIPEEVFFATAPHADIVGFAEASRRLYAEGCETSPVGFLEGWYVDPAWRRRGVGRALVAACEVWAQGLGCREFASDALADNLVSASAHAALGFEEVEVIRCFRKQLPSETSHS
jgi:aminoglycoside 6'-N-acetyltransferase I